MFDDNISPEYLETVNINAVREFFLSIEFKENVGERALILISPFPFLIIGTIQEVVSDYLVIKAEVTNIAELDDEVFRVHIDDIEVFYIEKPGEPKIPNIRDDNYA